MASSVFKESQIPTISPRPDGNHCRKFFLTFDVKRVRRWAVIVKGAIKTIQISDGASQFQFILGYYILGFDAWGIRQVTSENQIHANTAAQTWEGIAEYRRHPLFFICTEGHSYTHLDRMDRPHNIDQLY